MRLFVAVELDEAVRAAIVAAQKTLMPLVSSRDSGPRWSRPDQMHLTLAFIGHVDASRAAEIQSVCSEAIPLDPFEIGFGGVGVFPPRGAPRVLWLGVARGAEMLGQLHAIVAGRLTSAGVMLEERPYHPHITLGRWKFSRAADARRVRDLKPLRRPIDASVGAITLFESRQSPAGSVYTPLASGQLTGAHGHPLQ